ncbi:MAG: mechanosensitive ion channel domain-containing protein [Pseudomonadota bacterium]
MDAIIEKLSDPQLLMDQLVPIGIAWTSNILMALITLIVGFIIAGWLSRMVRRVMERTGRVDPIVTGFLSSLVRYVIIALTIVAVLGEFGIETTSIIAVFGAAGLAIGLALQGTLSHLAAGVMLLFFRPFKLGDFVEVNGMSGTVKDITLFTTDIATLDNKKVIVPNGTIWGNPITNFAANGTRRAETAIGISYSADIDKAQDVLRALLESDERVLSEPKVNVVVSSLGDSSVNLTAYYWTQAADFFATRMDMNKRVKQAYDKAGIDIPFPHLYVMQHKDEET